jgi:hypothetical protein
MSLHAGMHHDTPKFSPRRVAACTSAIRFGFESWRRLFGIFQELGLRLASAGHDSIQGFASPQQIDSISLRLRRSDYDYRSTASSR